MFKRALITGITGQDGSYLAELLQPVHNRRAVTAYNRSRPRGRGERVHPSGCHRSQVSSNGPAHLTYFFADCQTTTP